MCKVNSMLIKLRESNQCCNFIMGDNCNFFTFFLKKGSQEKLNMIS